MCNAQVLYGVNQRLSMEDVDSPLTEIRPVKSVSLVLVTGDRGLCGGYNNYVIKKVCAVTLSAFICAKNLWTKMTLLNFCR